MQYRKQGIKQSEYWQSLFLSEEGKGIVSFEDVGNKTLLLGFIDCNLH